ncbi:hypothetical protein [Limoniibacter endophyticus]|uniref:Surface antigen n=1 Tax=Limoniibacter endophyticus TaxID=1565040 RepID=A0A8J3DI56_9HYPH|nr:hypothetical protein [Limoniibacter endophyticus]GHC69266.1 hypothetical protein GCM10010136_14900 [Limoniibacter endophyticus]
MTISLSNVTRIAFVFAASASLAGCLSAGRPSMPQLPGMGTSQTQNAALASPDSNAIPTSGQGLIGGPIVKGLSGGARREALEAEYRALEHTQPNQPVAWGDGRLSGEVKAASPYSVGSQNCRQFTNTISASGAAPVTARGTACRNNDGSWALLN